MTTYSAYFEVDTHHLDIDAAVKQLGDRDAVVDMSDSGWVSARVSVEADSIVQAAASVAALADQVFGAELVMLEIMSDAEFTARETWRPAPADVLSITDTADILGISRQGVHAAIRDSHLHAIRVGRDWAVLHSSVDAYRFNQLYSVEPQSAGRTDPAGPTPR